MTQQLFPEAETSSSIERTAPIPNSLLLRIGSIAFKTGVWGYIVGCIADVAEAPPQLTIPIYAASATILAGGFILHGLSVRQPT
jgi:hypothetical protein